MTSGEVRRIRGGMMSVVVSDTVRPATPKTFTVTVIIVERPCVELEARPASSDKEHIPGTALCTHSNGSAVPCTSSASYLI